MRGLRKVIIGFAFIGSATFIAFTGIKEKSELLGLSTIIGAIAAGVAALVYGNIKENQADASRAIAITNTQKS